jgi:hypothetical protein
MSANQSKVSGLNMSGRTATFSVLGLMLIGACGEENSAQFDFDSQFGWIHGHCLAIRNPTLKIDDTITAIALDAQQALLVAKISGIGESVADCPALLEDRREVNASGDRTFYTISYALRNPQSGLAVGFVGSGSALTIAEGKVTGDFNGDGILDAIGSCNTSEGMRFCVSSGDEASCRWSDYYYLGYDLEPTCSD